MGNFSATSSVNPLEIMLWGLAKLVPVHHYEHSDSHFSLMTSQFSKTASRRSMHKVIRLRLRDSRSYEMQCS